MNLLCFFMCMVCYSWGGAGVISESCWELPVIIINIVYMSFLLLLFAFFSNLLIAFFSPPCF